jgi:von Willebrand factor type A domain
MSPLRLVLPCLCFALIACVSNQADEMSMSGGDEGPAPSGTDDVVIVHKDASDSKSPSKDEYAQGNGSPTAQSGLLTAGEFDDRLNEKILRSVLSDQLQTQGHPSFQWEMPTVLDLPRRFPASETPAQSMDLVFAIDATGSMGDEMSFLSAEFQSIVNRFTEKHPGVSLRFGLIFYRDVGDAYVTQVHNFTTSAETMQKRLASGRADGGGDFPEAMEKGLQAAQQFNWNASASNAQVLFLVADAPPHAENEMKFMQAAQALGILGVHLYPLAASGIDKWTETLMRAAAYQTGGTYLFLTDDSGIGNSHLEPSIPCYVVTRLDQLLIRVLDQEVLRKRVEPDSASIVREVGRYRQGVCEEVVAGQE